jgi:hypothetical protein
MFVNDLEYCLNNDFNPRWIPHKRLIYSKNLNISGKIQDISFSIVRDNKKFLSVHDLINDRYAWRGYGSNHSITSDAHHTTFAAEADHEVISTITLAVDSEDGLAMDRTFADVADKVRREPGTRICELTKLAFDAGVRSKEVLAGLFHLAFIYGTSTSDCTDLFIEVNPRHVRFYEMMLGFSCASSPRANASVGAPAQLMHLQVDVIRRNIREMAGKEGPAGGRSLYPHFFSPDDEGRIRLALASAHPPEGERAEPLLGANGAIPGREATPLETDIPVSIERATGESVMRRAA